VVIYGAAIYLARVRGLTQGEVGALLWIPPLGWEIGYFFWGWVADRMQSRSASIFFALTVLSLPLMLVPKAPSVVLVMAGLFLAMFAGAGFIILSISYATRVFPESQSGLIAGAGAGSWSAVVALVMPVFGRLFDQGSYDAAFALASIFPIAGFLAWRLLAVRHLAIEASANATP
jgi:MFS transporter, ACS family, hexuronate transporter